MLDLNQDTMTVQSFIFDYFNEVRVFDRDGENWFVAIDICRILGFTNPWNAVSILDEDEKDYVGISDAMNRIRQTLIISEPGLYKLIGRSRKPEAKEFDRWVRHEVLPTLRRDGMFHEFPILSEYGSNPTEAMQNIEDTLKTRSQKIASLHEDNTMLKAQVKALNSKAGYYNKTLYSDSFNTATNIASDYGITAYEFNRLLANLGIQYKSGNRWYLSRKYVGCGYTTVRTTHDENGNEIEFMAWTNIGLIFIQEVLYEYYGMVPRSQVPPWDFVVPEEYEE